MIIAFNDSAEEGFEEDFSHSLRPDVWYMVMNAVPRVSCQSRDNALEFSKNGLSISFYSLLTSAKRTSETGGCTVFTFVCLCVCLCALSPVFNSVCPSHNASVISIVQPISLPNLSPSPNPSCRIYALSERLLVCNFAKRSDGLAYPVGCVCQSFCVCVTFELWLNV